MTGLFYCTNTLAFTPAPEPQQQHTHGEQQWHQGNVDQLQAAAQGVNIGIQLEAHIAQLLTNPHFLGHKLLQRGLLFRCQLRRLRRVFTLLQAGQLLFGGRQTLL